MLLFWILFEILWKHHAPSLLYEPLNLYLIGLSSCLDVPQVSFESICMDYYMHATVATATSRSWPLPGVVLLSSTDPPLDRWPPKRLVVLGLLFCWWATKPARDNIANLDSAASYPFPSPPQRTHSFCRFSNLKCSCLWFVWRVHIASHKPLIGIRYCMTLTTQGQLHRIKHTRPIHKVAIAIGPNLNHWHYDGISGNLVVWA